MSAWPLPSAKMQRAADLVGDLRDPRGGVGRRGRAHKCAGEHCDHGQLEGTRECHGAFLSFLPLAYIRPSGASASRAFRIDQPSSAGPLANCSSALRCQPIKA